MCRKEDRFRHRRQGGDGRSSSSWVDLDGRHVPAIRYCASIQPVNGGTDPGPAPGLDTVDVEHCLECCRGDHAAGPFDAVDHTVLILLGRVYSAMTTSPQRSGWLERRVARGWIEHMKNKLLEGTMPDQLLRDLPQERHSSISRFLWLHASQCP